MFHVLWSCLANFMFFFCPTFKIFNDTVWIYGTSFSDSFFGSIYPICAKTLRFPVWQSLGFHKGTAELKFMSFAAIRGIEMPANAFWFTFLEKKQTCFHVKTASRGHSPRVSVCFAFFKSRNPGQLFRSRFKTKRASNNKPIVHEYRHFQKIRKCNE